MPIKDHIDWVRLAVDPKNLERAIDLAKAIKKIGLKVAFNVMYMSEWHNIEGLMDKLPLANEVVDLFCMVDSFGGIEPDEFASIFKEVRQKLTIPIGFHGHDNLELALANTIKAIEMGIDVVDATVTGMGRGAGNLKLELLLTWLNKKSIKDVDLNILGNLISEFRELHQH